jgi:hypothetical protein
MKNKSNYLLMLLLTIIISFPSICFSEQPNPKIWEPLGYNSYYNKKIITKAPGVLLVWTYKAMTDDTRTQRVEEVKKYDLEKSIKYQNYHHEADLWEIDCKNKMIKMEEFIDFDKNGMALDRYRYDNSERESIIPNSGGERLYQNVCITQKKISKKKR